MKMYALGYVTGLVVGVLCLPFWFACMVYRQARVRVRSR
jgi:hypothetical protein